MVCVWLVETWDCVACSSGVVPSTMMMMIGGCGGLTFSRFWKYDQVWMWKKGKWVYMYMALFGVGFGLWLSWHGWKLQGKWYGGRDDGNG
jgi:fluoride ion exporter CrcB/FEX